MVHRHTVSIILFVHSFLLLTATAADPCFSVRACTTINMEKSPENQGNSYYPLGIDALGIDAPGIDYPGKINK